MIPMRSGRADCVTRYASLLSWGTRWLSSTGSGRLQLANILPRPAPIVGLRNAISELSANGAETQGNVQNIIRLMPVFQGASGGTQRPGRFPEPGGQQRRGRQTGHEVSHSQSQRLEEDGLPRPESGRSVYHGRREDRAGPAPHAMRSARASRPRCPQTRRASRSPIRIAPRSASSPGTGEPARPPRGSSEPPESSTIPAV